VKERKADVTLPEAVGAARVRHLPGSMTQEVEQSLAQPLDVAQSKTYGSHAHAIPKTKEMWTTFKAEMDKAEMDKEDRLEGFKVMLFICLDVQHEEVGRYLAQLLDVARKSPKNNLRRAFM
jgi:hypothetical protein